MACLVHTTDTDKTRLSCLVGGLMRIGDKTVFSILAFNILETEQFCPVLSAVWMCLQIKNWIKTRCVVCSHRISRLNKTVVTFSVVDSLDLSPIVFTPSTRTRQDSPCRRCELGITLRTALPSIPVRLINLFSKW